MFNFGKSRTLMFSCYFVAIIVPLWGLMSAEKDEPAKKACPSNEIYFNCGANCQTECATLNEPCYVDYIQCPSGCYCAVGYARNAKNECIPESKCPPKLSEAIPVNKD